MGGQVPYLLRQAKEDNEYSLMRECYVHGLMKGEAFLHARSVADLTFDINDTAWLEDLHEDDIPFSTEDVVII